MYIIGQVQLWTCNCQCTRSMGGPPFQIDSNKQGRHMLKLSLGSLNMRPSCCCRSHTPEGVFDLIELLYWCFQTVLCQVVKPPLAQSIRPFVRSHRDPCTSACTNVTVACLRGERRRAADACITGAVLVCLVRSVTLATCVMWRRPCASEQGTYVYASVHRHMA